MAGTIDSAIERKRDKKPKQDEAEQPASSGQDAADSGGPGEGDSSATRDAQGATTRKEKRIGAHRKTLDH
jgi:hypothetical protein